MFIAKWSEGKLVTVSRAVRGKWWMCDAHWQGQFAANLLFVNMYQQQQILKIKAVKGKLMLSFSKNLWDWILIFNTPQDEHSSCLILRDFPVWVIVHGRIAALYTDGCRTETPLRSKHWDIYVLRYRHTHTQINSFIHRKQSVLLSVFRQNLHSFTTQEIPDGIQVMSNSCWRGKPSVRETSMSKLAHPEGVWPEGCLAGLFSLAGQKPSSPRAQQRRSDALGSSKLL